MRPTPNWLKVNFLPLVLAVALGMPTSFGFALAAEQPSAEQIIKALKPPRITRGLTTAPPDTARAAEDKRFIDTLRNRTTRSLTIDERSRIASIAKERPSIDLEINFEFNSAVISPKALPQITALGEALTSPDLSGRIFVLAGHTDAVGDPAYNLSLSQLRSDAVKRFLMEKYGIEASHLLTVGHGKTQLKNPSNPYAGENRRVQVVNVADKQ
jgi:outer membrane protein OmpA-like peptidoglycan-associated protein